MFIFAWEKKRSGGSSSGLRSWRCGFGSDFDIDFLLDFGIVLTVGLVRTQLWVGWNSCAADPRGGTGESSSFWTLAHLLFDLSSSWLWAPCPSCRWEALNLPRLITFHLAYRVWVPVVCVCLFLHSNWEGGLGLSCAEMDTLALPWHMPEATQWVITPVCLFSPPWKMVALILPDKGEIWRFNFTNVNVVLKGLWCGRCKGLGGAHRAKMQKSQGVQNRLG